MHGTRRTWIAPLIATIGMIPASSIAGPLDPLQFTSLGTLSLGSGATGLISGTSLITSAGVFTGVNYNGITVFDFSSISIAAGANITAAAFTSPVAFLSQTGANINGIINVSAAGSMGFSGPGNGGPGVLGNFQGGPSTIVYSGAGGGGFGGAGGQGGSSQTGALGTVLGGAGGLAYANLASVLQTGSSGGSGSAYIGGKVVSSLGGAGGGAIEIGAVQLLSIGGSILANGGDVLGQNAGGGSGGGIFLHANTVNFFGLLSAQGGAGGIGGMVPAGLGGIDPEAILPGGGGGGGEILVEAGPGGLATFGNARASAAGGLGAQGGASGILLPPALVPEPSSLFLFGTSILGLLGLTAFRRLREVPIVSRPSR